MAIYRNIQMTFWTDVELVDGFTPEDKYFYLYLLTNPHTNLAGCYEISLKQISDETGYTKEVVEKLLDRMERVHRKIIFCPETKEVLVLNWYKHNWTTSDKFVLSVKNTIEKIKNNGFKTYLLALLDNEQDTVSIPYRYPMDTSVTVYNTPNYTDVKVISRKPTKEETYMEQVREIIEYLNLKTKKSFTTRNKQSNKYIIARLKEGFTVEECKKVIDNKVNAWGHIPKMIPYLRPITLFDTRFESYLNDCESENQKKEREDAEINERQRQSYDDETAHFFE